jgi:hypothetical protein
LYLAGVGRDDESLSELCPQCLDSLYGGVDEAGLGAHHDMQYHYADLIRSELG